MFWPVQNDNCRKKLIFYPVGDRKSIIFVYSVMLLLLQDEPCRFVNITIGATDKGYVDITSGDEKELKEAVATIGPISVAIDAGGSGFQSYTSGQIFIH